MNNLLKLMFLSIFTIVITVFLVNSKQNDPNLHISPNISDNKLPISTTDYMQGVWVSTVFNLDFPSSQNMSENDLKLEIKSILDDVKSREITDVFFQVRPQADAFYPSKIFETSVYLTGNQDSSPPFDILDFYIKECHARGIKLHAWINPYRITKSSNDVLSSDHIAVKQPNLTVNHTDGNLYFDPALEDVQQLILDGIEEIITNYDVDGIHFDDYFYPSSDFNDSDSFNKLGNGKTLDEFRRDNVTSLVEKVSILIDKKSPDILFSISPSGIWANKSDMPDGSDTNGSGSYFKQYADTKKWVELELIDCIIPQIYWNIGFEIAEYKTLVDWWCDVVADTNVDLYIGHANYKEFDKTFESGEIDRQIEYNKTKSEVNGSVFFRYKTLT